jgi:hypothetical protein
MTASLVLENFVSRLRSGQIIVCSVFELRLTLFFGIVFDSVLKLRYCPINVVSVLLQLLFNLFLKFILKGKLAKTSSVCSQIVLKLFEHLVVFLFDSSEIVMKLAHFFPNILEFKFSLSLNQLALLGNYLIDPSLSFPFE